VTFGKLFRESKSWRYKCSNVVDYCGDNLDKAGELSKNARCLRKSEQKPSEFVWMSVCVICVFCLGS